MMHRGGQRYTNHTREGPSRPHQAKGSFTPTQMSRATPYKAILSLASGSKGGSGGSGLSTALASATDICMNVRERGWGVPGSGNGAEVPKEAMSFRRFSKSFVSAVLVYVGLLRITDSVDVNAVSLPISPGSPNIVRQLRLRQRPGFHSLL